MGKRIPLAILTAMTLAGLAIVTGCQNGDPAPPPAAKTGSGAAAAGGAGSGINTYIPNGGGASQTGPPRAGDVVDTSTAKPGAPLVVNHPHLNGGGAVGASATGAPH